MLKEVEVTIDGKQVKFSLMSLTYGQRNACLRRATNMRVGMGAQTMDVDPFLFNEYRLIEAIITPAEYKSLDKIRGLPEAAGDALVAALDEVSELNPKSKDA